MSDENVQATPGGSERGLAPVPFEGGDRVPASPAAMASFQDAFLRLIERRAAAFTMGESTSVPRHVAVDLVRSVCFVLGMDPDEPTVPPELLAVDLEAEFRRRLADLERKVELTEKLLRDARADMPVIPSIALRDTLAEIGGFFARYDFRSMAHEIPCSIDYPLCHPVPESLAGVDYVHEYLRRLLVESDFLRRFELDACVRVLESTCPDYEGLIVNLYEPIATNAIGRALIGKDPLALDITDEDRAGIAKRLGAAGRGGRTAVVRETALTACPALGVRDDAGTAYLADLVPELMPRIEVGLSRDDLGGVFVSFRARGRATARGASPVPG